MPIIRILGIDPGLRNMGWGMIEQDGSKLHFIACGTVKSDEKRELSQRLRQLHDGLQGVIASFSPDEVAVEETFVNKDARATLKLGQARGIALLVPALNGLSVGEYAPNLIKKTVVGSGHADKDQIHMMVKVLLPKSSARISFASAPLSIRRSLPVMPTSNSPLAT